MLYNKRTLIIAITVSVISLGVFLCFSICEKIYDDIIIQLSCGIFGSATLIFITSIVGYFVERDRVLHNIEQYYNSCNMSNIIYCNKLYEKKENSFNFDAKDYNAILTILLNNIYLLKKELSIFRNGCCSCKTKKVLKNLIKKINALQSKIHFGMTNKAEDYIFNDIFYNNGDMLKNVLLWVQSNSKETKTYNNP